MTTTAPATSFKFTLAGHAGDLHGRCSTWIALLCHGYGEHLGRYEWGAQRLVSDGGVVYAIDHVGHGGSDGEPVVIEDFEPVVDDFACSRSTPGREALLASRSHRLFDGGHDRRPVCAASSG